MTSKRKATRTPRSQITGPAAEELMENFLNALVLHSKTPKSSLLSPLILRSDGQGFPVDQVALRLARKIAIAERAVSKDATARFSARIYEHWSTIALGDTISELKYGTAIAADKQGNIDTAGVLTFYRTMRDAKLALVAMDLYRHIPCHVFHSTKALTTFSIGPVQFMDRKSWAKQYIGDRKIADAVISVWDRRSNKPPSNTLSGAEQHRVDAVLNTVKAHEWLGTVLIKDHDTESSHNEARVLVGLAIDCLGVVLEAAEGTLLNIAGSPFTRGGSRLATTTKGALVSGSTARLPGLGGRPEMADQLIADTVSFREAAGNILSAYASARQSGKDAPWLIERWVNALHWFGEARRESSDFMAVVKYGCALDILSGAGGNLDQMAKFVIDAVGVSEAIDDDGKKLPIRTLVNNLFNDGRSALAHGEAFGLLSDRSQDRARADKTVQEVIQSVTEPLGAVVKKNEPMLSVPKGAQIKAFQLRLASRWPQPSGSTADK